MKRFSVLVVALAGLLASATSAQAARGGLDVYTGTIDSAQVGAIVDLGVDRHELEVRAAGRDGAKGNVRVEAILSAGQAAKLRRDGIALTTKKVQGESVAQRATALAAQGFEVYSKYSGRGACSRTSAAPPARTPASPRQ